MTIVRYIGPRPKGIHGRGAGMKKKRCKKKFQANVSTKKEIRSLIESLHKSALSMCGIRTE